MSAGPPAAEGSVSGGPVPDRAGTLAMLARELRAAERCNWPVQAARLRGRIALLSAGSPASPAKETA